MKNRFRKQNFTLQEMMVVITIIVILCMLLLPAINSVREIAKRSTCLSRVREVSQLQAKYAAQNDGQVPLSGGYIPVGKKVADRTDFSVRIMESLIPEAVGERDYHWWMFICTNVLPYWNAGATMNANGYTKGKKNQILEPVWQKIKPGSQGETGHIGYTKGRGADATQDAVYSFGNFACNMNGDIIERVVTNINVTSLHTNDIKSPSKRAFIVEEGEAVNQDNATHTVQYVKYNDAISRGQNSKGTATGYIPGMGGGGIGREKMERIGYDSTISEDELDTERLELVKKDVMEGRHAGATLHGFFDGHAEAIDVATVGSLQLGPGDKQADLKGPYGKITEAADDDEK